MHFRAEPWQLCWHILNYFWIMASVVASLHLMLAPHLTSYTPPYTFIPFLNPPKILTFQNHNTQSTSQFPHRNPLYNPKNKAPPKSHAEIPNAIQTKATSQHNTIEFLKTLRGTRKSTNSVARLGQCPLAHAPAHPPNLQVSSILLVPPLPPNPSPLHFALPSTCWHVASQRVHPAHRPLHPHPRRFRPSLSALFPTCTCLHSSLPSTFFALYLQEMQNSPGCDGHASKLGTKKGCPAQSSCHEHPKSPTPQSSSFLGRRLAPSKSMES